jgi:hypothetical protein
MPGLYPSIEPHLWLLNRNLFGLVLIKDVTCDLFIHDKFSHFFLGFEFLLPKNSKFPQLSYSTCGLHYALLELGKSMSSSQNIVYFRFSAKMNASATNKTVQKLPSKNPVQEDLKNDGKNVDY